MPEARSMPSSLEPKAFKLKLTTAESKRRWSHLVQLKHKHCRFLHQETIVAMGIADEITQLMQRGGFTNIFQGNYFTYHILTVEFLSTLVVERVNQVPHIIRFQLGGQPRELDMDQLSDIIGGNKEGEYIGNNHPNLQDLWAQFVDFNEERTRSYNPAKAKATSIRNPTIRYFHRLISCTIHSRHDSGTFLATDAHLIWTSYRNHSQCAALYLVDHMENQAYLFGGQKIGIGAFVTPIAQHFNIPIVEQPVSTSIYVDRRTLELARMISYDTNGWYFKLHGRSGVHLFPLPNNYLTEVIGNEKLRRGNGRMDSPQHKELMWAEGGPRPDEDGDDDEEDNAEDEDEQYEQGFEQEEDAYAQGYEGVPQPGFHMRAPEFSTMRDWHTESMEAMDNYHWDGREFVESQVRGVREEVQTLRTEVGDLRTYIGGRFDSLDAYFENERRFREEEAKRREDERAYMENYNRMVHEMHYFYPHYPESHQRFDPNNPNNPPFPPPFP